MNEKHESYFTTDRYSLGRSCSNVACMDKLISAHAQGTDLFVLPEMFSTGFCTSPEGIAESSDSATLQWMKQKAAEHNCAIAGSVSVEENGKFYNRFYFVHPDGNVQWYNKKHLFTYGGEDKHYTAGQERVVVNFRGVRFLLEVCYDLRFPVWSRNRGDYDAAIYVASWPSPRVEAWKALLRARAIENQCYVLGVNRVGRIPIANIVEERRALTRMAKHFLPVRMGKKALQKS